MRIPVSQGRISSQPTLQQHTPNQGLSNIGRAIGQAMQGREEKLREAEAKQKQIALYHDQMAEEEAKVKLDDVLTSELAEQSTLLKNDVANGALSADEANTRLQEWSQTRYKQMESEMPQHAAHKLQAYFNDHANRTATGFLPLQLRADAQKGVVLADRYADIATRMDRDAGREYIKNNLQKLNIPEADKQARLYQYESSRDVLDIDERMSNAVQSKNPEMLQELLNQFDNGAFQYLDAQTLQQKKNQVYSRIDAINHQIEVEENKRVQMASKVLSDYKAQVMTGRALDDAYINDVSAAVAGTEHEAEFNFYKQQSSNLQAFSRLSTTDMEKRINEQKAASKNSKTADAVTEEKLLAVYESLYNEKKKTIKENPNQAVREAGLETHTVTGAELKNDPTAFASKVIENAVSQFALKDANLSIKPIASEDLPGAKQAFDALDVNGKLNLISSLITQTKGVPQGSRIWGTTLGQLGGGDQAYIMAGVARSNNYRSSNGEDVATAIVSGTQALKNKQLVMPKDELLKNTFNQYMGQSVSGTTSNLYYAAFKSIYAHLSERDGFIHKDQDVLNKELAKTALSLASGGIYEQGVKYGSQKTWKVSKPYGWTDEKFEDRLEKGYSVIADRTGISVSELKEFRLRRNDGANGIQYDLVNERGNPLVVDGTAWRINFHGVK